MPLPAPDLTLVERYCSDGSPAEFADQARLECEVKGSTVTLIEATKLDLGQGEEWLRTPLARLAYDDSSALWTLLCFDRDSRAMRYDKWEPDFVQPTTLAGILAEIDADPTNIFWG